MAFELPKLTYAMDALAPYISSETLEYHYGKHHAAYVNKANELIKGTGFEGKPLAAIVRSADRGALFNNVAQHYNHSFYWNCLAPAAGGEPGGTLAGRIRKSFGDFAAFKKRFSDAATGHFGSGWVWLFQATDGSLKVEAMHDAESPLIRDETPLLTCDVWEHAYYIDYRNARPKYVEAFWNLVNWEFAASNLK